MSELIINGPAGRLQTRYHQSEDPSAPIAIVLHPHPLHHGTMNNKVVYSLYDTFRNNGFSVARFNFRGVEKSSGEFDNGVGELLDAAYVLDWMQKKNPYSKAIWMSGFSFGALIATQLVMRRPEIQKFIAISPPVNKYDFSFFSPCPTPGLIIQGDMDSVVSEKSVTEFVEKINSQAGGRSFPSAKVDYVVVNGADHFFRNNMDELNDTIQNYVKEHANDQEEENTGNKRMRSERKRRSTNLLDEIF